MAYTDIDKPSDYFNTKLYTGNDTGQSITGVGFQPDWVWIKSRTDTNSHNSWDSVRGVNKYLENDTTKVETTVSNGVTSFDSDGFTVGSRDAINDNNLNFVSWNWKAGTSFTNDASSTGIGSIDSAGSVNTDAGFSIVKYDSSRSPSAVQTVAHGLGVKPDMLIFKNLNESQNWLVWNKTLATNKHLNLNTTSALSTDAGSLNNTAPTSSVFTIGADGRTNSTTNGNPIICYAFAEKKGYSKFGSYTGNGSTDGVFCFTGMKVGWLMIKRTDSANSWIIMDNKRTTFNPMGEELKAEVSDVGNVATRWDHLSNGFKLRNGSSAVNASGGTYIYYAFAENPFVTSTGVPACAR